MTSLSIPFASNLETHPTHVEHHPFPGITAVAFAFPQLGLPPTILYPRVLQPAATVPRGAGLALLMEPSVPPARVGCLLHGWKVRCWVCCPVVVRSRHKCHQSVIVRTGPRRFRTCDVCMLHKNSNSNPSPFAPLCVWLSGGAAHTGAFVVEPPELQDWRPPLLSPCLPRQTGKINHIYRKTAICDEIPG